MPHRQPIKRDKTEMRIRGAKKLRCHAECAVAEQKGCRHHPRGPWFGGDPPDQNEQQQSLGECLVQG